MAGVRGSHQLRHHLLTVGLQDRHAVRLVFVAGDEIVHGSVTGLLFEVLYHRLGLLGRPREHLDRLGIKAKLSRSFAGEGHLRNLWGQKFQLPADRSRLPQQFPDACFEAPLPIVGFIPSAKRMSYSTPTIMPGAFI